MNDEQNKQEQQVDAAVPTENTAQADAPGAAKAPEEVPANADDEEKEELPTA